MTNDSPELVRGKHVFLREMEERDAPYIVEWRNHPDTAQWLTTLRQARALGSVQCGFSGGEPLMRDDLTELVSEAHQLGYYTNLIRARSGSISQEQYIRGLAGGLKVRLGVPTGCGRLQPPRRRRR